MAQATQQRSRPFTGRSRSLRDPATLKDLLAKTISKWNEDPVLRFGAALAYYSAFAVVPLMIITTMLAGAFIGQEAAEGHMVQQIEGLLGEQSAAAVKGMLDHWREAGSTWWGILVTAIALFFAATGAFDVLQDALNSTWGVEPKPQPTSFKKLRQRFLSFMGLLGTAFLLLVSLTLNAGLAELGLAFVSALPAPDVVVKIVSAVVSFLAMTFLFAMIFKMLPKARIAWSDVWIGAFVTAVLFSIGKWLIVLWLGKSFLVALYGVEGAFVIILLWAYFTSQTLLFGAEFTAVYASRFGSRIVPTQDAVATGEPARTDDRRERAERQAT
jgi:membrane protein